MVLPGHPGLALLPEAERLEVAAIMVTGAKGHDEQMEAMRRGAYDVLPKPVHPGRLLMAVTRAADRVRLARQNRELLQAVEARAAGLELEGKRLAAEVERRAGLIARGKQEWERTFDAIREPIALLGPDLRVLRGNRSFAAWAGLAVTEIPGRACHEALFALPRPCRGCPLEAASADPADATLEIGPRAIRVGVFPLHGHGTHAVVHEDVTEARRLSRRLQDAERLASVAKLAAGVAHEINNPLGFVAANLCSVRETCAALLAGDQALNLGEATHGRLADALAALDQSVAGAERMKAIVQALQVLAAERPSGVRSVDAAECLERAVRQARSALDPFPEVADVWVRRTERPALADPLRLDRALRELVKNALQASPPGGRLTLATFEERGRVGIEVADDGPGMPEDVRRRACEPFFTTRPLGTGVGLGLTIAYGIVRQMGGEIRVDSEAGRGTRVQALLPATDADCCPVPT
jgi:signal transduction histidine kinase